MNKLKIIFQYIFGITLSLCLTLLVLVRILNKTVCKKEYIKSTLNETNYYETINRETLEEMKNYMISSGLPEEVLKDIYTKEEIKKDVNSFIDDYYEGKKHKVDKDRVKLRLTNNIDAYLKENHETVTSNHELNEFIEDITDIYEKEVTLYHFIDNYASVFYKISYYLNVVTTILFFVTIFIFVIECFLKTKFIGSIFISSGLNMLLILYFLSEKIDYKNILVISDYFSKVMKHIFEYILKISLTSSSILIILGLILNFVLSFEKRKLKK